MISNLLEILLDNIPYSVWLRSIDGEFLFANKHYADSLGLDKSNIIGKNLNELYPIDLANEYEGNYIEVINSGNPKLFTGYLDDIFLECYIAPIKINNKIEMFLGILQNQTSRKKYEDEIIKQKELLQTIIDTIPDCIFHKDIEGTYLHCNKAFAKEYYKTDKKEIIGKSDKDLEKIYIRETESKNKLSMINEIVKFDRQVIESNNEGCKKIKIKIDDDNAKYMESRKVPIFNKNGDVSSIVGVARDVTENVILENKLKKMSYTDKLTGLYNRAYFDEKIRKLNSQKYLPLSLIMGDVNGLKVVNDTLGHLQGDKLLIDISTVIKSSCRKKDLIFRWGGDEICIILPKTTAKEAELICDEIKENCKEKSDSIIPLSIALGTSTKNDIRKEIDKVLTEAEDKTYREKLLHGKSIKSFIIGSLQETLAQKHPQTEEHTDRVIKYAKRLGKRLNLSNDNLNKLILLATLHDIGKIGIPDEILSKPGVLDSEEFEIMKTHTGKGYRIAMLNPDIEHIAKGILTHHERYDGKGYPLGLKGEEIPFLARIICVVDAYDAMTSDRTYKNKISKNRAKKELIKCSGNQFDPHIVKVFLKEIEND
ncbi:diguanylate cyclase [Bacillus sp. BAU-SS-2023]|nr:diguanylate cyclase [Bacillus sp. BAU-SS-2023]